LLGSARARDLFLKVFEQVRRRYDFEVIGFVVMPEHVHLLISEPKRGNLPIVMQVLKQRVSLRLLRKRKLSSQRELWENERRRLWQRRYYDFNVYSDRKVTEKLRYMHRNPGPPTSAGASTPQSNIGFAGTPVLRSLGWKSGGERIGVLAGTVALEQLSRVCLSGTRDGETELAGRISEDETKSLENRSRGQYRCPPSENHRG
jgi:REP element-mobilizing transposase RayT